MIDKRILPLYLQFCISLGNGNLLHCKTLSDTVFIKDVRVYFETCYVCAEVYNNN